MHMVFYLLPCDKVIHPLSALICLTLFEKISGCQIVSTWGESKLSSWGNTGCFSLATTQHLALSVVQYKDLDYSEGMFSTVLL